MGEDCEQNVRTKCACLVCTPDEGDNVTADDWHREHYQNFIDVVWECTDVQTLRALAHRLGYKEGT